jgi:hypothetical protein
MNWTSTTVPLWQIDCDNFRRVGRPFELRDVTTMEHERFVEMFCARYDIECIKDGTIVRFDPTKKNISK